MSVLWMMKGYCCRMMKHCMNNESMPTRVSFFSETFPASIFAPRCNTDYDIHIATVHGVEGLLQLSSLCHSNVLTHKCSITAWEDV